MVMRKKYIITTCASLNATGGTIHITKGFTIRDKKIRDLTIRDRQFVTHTIRDRTIRGKIITLIVNKYFTHFPGSIYK